MDAALSKGNCRNVYDDLKKLNVRGIVPLSAALACSRVEEESVSASQEFWCDLPQNSLGQITDSCSNREACRQIS